MTLFRLDVSFRTEGSHSRQIADLVQREWDDAHPGETVINREIAIDPLPSDAWAEPKACAGAVRPKATTPGRQSATTRWRPFGRLGMLPLRSTGMAGI